MLDLSALLFAHTPTPGLGDFWNGLFHPCVDPEQGFALLALAIASAREAEALARRTAIAGAAALGAAAVLHLWLPVKAPSVPGLALLLAGLLLVRPPQRMTAWLPPLALLVGLSLGHSIGTEIPSRDDGFIFVLGFGLGCVTIINYTMLGWARFHRGWMVVASRILGSWLVAIGMMLVAGYASGTLKP